MILQNGAQAVAAVSGIDIDVDFLTDDNFVRSIQSDVETSHKPPTDALFDAKASTVTIQEYEAAQDAHDESEFKAEPIESSPLREKYELMTCAELRSAIRKLEVHKAKLVSANVFDGSNNGRIENIEGKLAVADSVRLDKLLGGDTACNF